MESTTREALKDNIVIDITTTGRKTGEARRIEVRLHEIDGDFYLSGAPGKRSWYANLLAHPRFTVHLKDDVKADVPAEATPIMDAAERRAVFTKLLTKRGQMEQMDARMTSSALVRLRFED